MVSGDYLLLCARLALLDQLMRPLGQVTLLEVARTGLPFEVFQEIGARKLLEEPSCRKLYARAVLTFAFFCTSTTPSGEAAAALIDREQQKAKKLLKIANKLLDMKKSSSSSGQPTPVPGFDPEEYVYTSKVLEEQREYLIRFFES